jgi:HD-GYP domain-containing protein (c-di-GMP phosphodiesterase class II)
MLLEHGGGSRLAAAYHLPPALEADGRAAMRWPGCACQRRLTASEDQGAVNIMQCERLQRAQGDTRGLQHHACIPLRVGPRSLGSLNLATAPDRVFTSDELDLLTTIADQLGMAIERARLYEAQHDRHEVQQAALLKFAQQLVALDESQAVLECAAEAALKVLQPELVGLWLPEQSGRMLMLQAGRGWEAEAYHSVSIELGSSTEGQVFAHGQTVGLAGQTFTDQPGYQSLLRRRGIHSSWSAPLLGNQGALGVLSAYFRQVPGGQDVPNLLALIASHAAVAYGRTDLLRAEREQREIAVGLGLALRAGAALSTSLNLETVLDQLLEQVARVVPYDAAALLLRDPDSGLFRVARARGYEQFGPAIAAKIGQLEFDVQSTPNLRRIVERQEPLVIADTTQASGWLHVEGMPPTRSWAGAPIYRDSEIVAVFSLDKLEPDFYRPEHITRLSAFAGQAALALHNARLFQSLQDEKRRLELLYLFSRDLTHSLKWEEIAQRTLDQISRSTGAFKVELLLADTASDQLMLVAVSGVDAKWLARPEQRITMRMGEGLAGHAAHIRAPVIASDVSRNKHWRVFPGIDDDVRSAVAIPLLADDMLIGVLNVLSREPDHFQPSDITLLAAVAAPLALTLQNARLYAETHRRANELAALAELSAALRQAQSREQVADILAHRIMRLFNAESGALLMLESEALAVLAACGDQVMAQVGERHEPSATPLWQAVRTGAPWIAPDARAAALASDFYQKLIGSLQVAICIPLKAGEATIGVLHLAWASPRGVDNEEMRLLSSAAEIAGSALHRSALLDGLRRSHMDLEAAYDSTLEGWSRALEMRDAETQGHTLRVADLAVRLARALNVPEPEIIQLRRGALLHDMGKLGVPDQILRKTGPLNPAEQGIMQLHPGYAYEMLAPIAYLRPALDIPHRHHERWDGSGYPGGLRGEEIPLAARVFAVVDVWDALTHDRPYRGAWSADRAQEYLCEQAGRQFEPRIVDVFLALNLQQTGPGVL